MERRFFNEAEVAEYLNLGPDDIRQRVKDGEIPFELRGKRTVFDQGAIDAWASKRIMTFSEGRLVDYHQKSMRGTSTLLPEPAILPQLLRPEFIAPAMTGKTKASTLRELVKLADGTGRLNDPKALVENLEAREKLGSTALPGGIALPHPGRSDAYLFESPFIIVGRPIQAINFGASDGQPTNLFFLICCPDNRLHLHTIARLCLLVQTTEVVAQINSAPDAESIFQCLMAAEQAALEK